MHTFLRSVGFKDVSSDEIQKLICDGVSTAISEKNVVYREDKKKIFVRIECGKGMGISVVCDIGENNLFTIDHYMPFLISERLTDIHTVYADKHSYNDSYGLMTDDLKINNTIVSTFENAYCYNLEMFETNTLTDKKLGLTGFSYDGVILLPIMKEATKMAEVAMKRQEHIDYQRAAKEGDEDAMEHLALEEMDMYTNISKRVTREDIYSIVDSTFIPCGVECDSYSIVGEILSIREILNKFTAQTIYDMEIECNDLFFNVAINKEDLKGEPCVGRRFKGHIWLNGRIVS